MRGLFTKLLSLFKSDHSVSEGLYHPKKRMIYCYFDGKKDVKADPMVLYRRAMENGPELSIDLKVANIPNKDSAKAHKGAVEKIRKIFSLVSFEDGGLTELETLDLLDHFFAFCDGVKKNSSASPTSVPSQEGSKPLPAESPSISSSSVSGSTEKEPSIEPQEAFPMEQQLPSDR